MRLTILLLFISVFLNAQNKSDYFRAYPSEYEIAQAPQWAQLMYSEDPNVSEVIESYQKYFEVNEFKKTIHTQNYKFWIKSVEYIINTDDKLRAPTREQEEAYFKKLSDKKERSSEKSMDIWTSIGPFETYKNGTSTAISTHANVYSIDQSTQNSNLLICGTESGGVFKTTDLGLTWSLISKQEVFCNGITAVAIHPTNDDIFYISGNSRIYRSLDGGSTWSENFYAGGSIYEIKFDPEDVDHIFLIGGPGLFESHNGGTSWTNRFSETCWDLDFHPTDNDTLYLLKSNSTAKMTEFYRSLDSGANWSLVNNGWYSPEVPVEASENGGKIAVSPQQPDRVYACLVGSSKANDNGWIGIYRSDNSGTSWYLPSGQIGGPYNSINTMPWNAAAYGSGYHQGFYNFDFEASPSDADLMWFGTIRLSESSDGAYTYSSIGAANSTRLSDIHADIQSIHVNNNDIWVASDGGINYSNDNLQTHDSRKYGIIASNFWGFGAGWNEDVLVGGKYHNGNTVYYENYGVGNSHNVGGVEEATGYVNPQNNKTVYFNQYWSGYTVAKSISENLGGATSNLSPVNLIPNESYFTSYSSGFYHHPIYSDHILAGKDSLIYKSIDGGNQWSPLHNFGVGRVLEIEISRANPNVIYAVFQPNGGYWDWCRIYKSVDNGVTWNALKDIPTNRWRLEITTNPLNENEIWAASLNGSNGNKIYMSQDGGNSWSNMTSNVFDGDKIRDILYHGGSNKMVYAVTEQSFYYYDEPNWIQYDTGLPVVQNVKTLKLFYRDSKIRLSTGGRGIWEANLPQTFSPIALAMTNVDSVFCSRDTVQLESHSIIDHQNASWQWSISPNPLYIEATNIRNPKVVFGSDGQYDISLTVTDENNQSDISSISNMVIVESLCDADTIQGYAVGMNDVGDYVQLPDFNTMTNSFSMTAWIKPNGIQNNYSSILMNDGDAAGLNFRESNNTLGYHWPGGSWSWDSNLVAEEGMWSHVALVVSPTQVRIYLNGIEAVHNTSINTVDLTTMKIGSYKGWGSRNYQGEVDEVVIWNRALTQEEVRLFKHLTKEDVITDPDMLAYYQFNSGQSTALDKANLNHGSLVGASQHIECLAPFGGGVSARQVINNSGNYIFTNTGISLDFQSGGTYPNGDIIVSRINAQPLPQVQNNEGLGSFFIINNYGNNSFNATYSLSFDDPYSSPSADAINEPNTLRLRNRSDNAFDLSWQNICALSSVNGENYNFESTLGCADADFGQYYIHKCLFNKNITMDVPANESLHERVENIITAQNTILSGANVKYSAGNYISLDPDFEVKAGAIFETDSDACEN